MPTQSRKNTTETAGAVRVPGYAGDAALRQRQRRGVQPPPCAAIPLRRSADLLLCRYAAAPLCRSALLLCYAALLLRRHANRHANRHAARLPRPARLRQPAARCRLLHALPRTFKESRAAEPIATPALRQAKAKHGKSFRKSRRRDRNGDSFNINEDLFALSTARIVLRLQTKRKSEQTKE